MIYDFTYFSINIFNPCEVTIEGMANIFQNMTALYLITSLLLMK